MMNLVDFMQFAGNSEGAKKGWEDRRRTIQHLRDAGWKGGDQSGGVYRMGSSDGKSVMLVHNDGDWEHHSVTPTEEGGHQYKLIGRGRSIGELSNHLLKH